MRGGFDMGDARKEAARRACREPMSDILAEYEEDASVMASKTIIYHNPQCGKSRQTLALIRDGGIEPEIIEYLKTPPTEEELKNILENLGIRPRELIRSGEKIYKQLSLEESSLSDAALIAAMVREPILIERPIVIRGDKAMIGRPPECVLELLK